MNRTFLGRLSKLTLLKNQLEENPQTDLAEKGYVSYTYNFTWEALTISYQKNKAGDLYCEVKTTNE